MNSLDELINDRSEKVRLMQKDGDNSHKLLAQLYGNSTHFITELLQNAEDEGARKVIFELTENELIFSHDAKKLFDFNDIRAISNFGDNQEKKDKSNAIGRFGIGFKSVYSITDNPRIVSAEFDITIHHFNIPERTNKDSVSFYEGTKITLPFKSENKEEIKKILSRELKDLNLNYLLFLSNISSIKWKTQDSEGEYVKVQEKKDKRFITLKSLTKELQYLLFERTVSIDNKELSVKIAFQLDGKNKQIIIPCEESPLFVFFPTKIETNLKFLIHAPFYTTPARENIQDSNSINNIKEDHRNEKLKTELSRLLVSSFTDFIKLHMINVDFLNILPIDKSNINRSIIYKELYEAVKEELKSNKKLLPNSNGILSAACDLMLLGSSDLASLLKINQSKKIFGRSFWLNKGITKDKTKTLRDYLFQEIGIPEYDLTQFISKLDEKFIKDQDDKWLIQFYKTIHKAPALWKTSGYQYNNNIRNKPIIRVENGKNIYQVLPFKTDGKPNAFLPTKDNTEYATVKKSIANNKEARKFLEDLGLTTPDIFAEINEFIIPKLKKCEEYPSYYNDIKKIIDAYYLSGNERRSRLIRDLQPIPFLIGHNTKTNSTKFLKYNNIYLITENLIAYFNETSVGYFVEEKKYVEYVPENRFKSFLSDLGVKTVLWRREAYSTLSPQEKADIRNNSRMTYENHCKDYYLDGLEEVLKKEITISESLALWKILTKQISDDPYQANIFFQGEYSYRYYSDHKKYFDSYFLKQLKQNKWLIINEEHFKPSEVSYSILPEIYKSNGSDLKQLADILGFKPDEIKIIEDKTGGKFLSKDELPEYEEYKKWKQEKDSKIDKANEKEDNKFTPLFKPEEVILNSRELSYSEINVNFNNSQGNIKHNILINTTNLKEEIEASNQQTTSKGNVETDSKFLNDIGKWGEAYVLYALRKEFSEDSEIEILNLNDNQQKGIGCDFLIRKNGDNIRIVEVKTTVEEFGQALIISGTQWEVARNLYNSEDGDKYWIYCVFNAGKENSEIIKIENPIQKWKNGQLFAHPINFIIK